MPRTGNGWLRALLLGLLLPLVLPLAAQPGQGAVMVLPLEGTIGPATADLVARTLERAAERNAALLVLQIDTPGGLDLSMRDIVKRILASPVPVVGYVAPSGARAASAGTFILYACHVAAMAPGTSLGAATPVRIGGGPPILPRGGAPPDEEGPGKKGGREGKEEAPSPPPDALQRKVVNDAVAYIRGLAELRGRNAEWAERAVREGASLPAHEALALGVTDLVARDLSDLLQQLEGRTVTLAGEPRTLHVTGLEVERVEPDWRSRLLAVITNPNVAYLLLIIGIYGLIFEFSSPGAILPGVAGGICLLLALFAFQLLPVSYAGLALVLLGAGLMVAEAFVPSFGVLGIGGLIAFVIGSILLIDVDQPGYGIEPWLIGAVALFSGLFFILVIGMAVRAQRKPVVSGREELLGARGVALEDFGGRGRVRVHGETWHALTEHPLRRGQEVRVTGISGLTLRVEPLSGARTEESS
ncbi:MAG: nodulation protein NfeD [Gammaproteobacteria bacterium]|nr:MAG: nodulation protein NfeD [Gammaproteobacteria bacterium]